MSEPTKPRETSMPMAAVPMLHSGPCGIAAAMAGPVGEESGTPARFAIGQGLLLVAMAAAIGAAAVLAA